MIEGMEYCGLDDELDYQINRHSVGNQDAQDQFVVT